MDIMEKKYSKTIGYSPLDLVDHDKLLRVIRVNKKIIDEYLPAGKGETILVAGAGTGYEAVLINQEFQLKTVGVDLNIDLNNSFPKSSDLLFQRQDLTSLAFDENTFDLVYCYHVLEHVADHLAVLKEIYRVLKTDGILFVGFPNKNRLISYVGTSQKASGLEKIKWNINDYLFRLQGKFENKYGAHAGFTEKEFIKDASIVFETIDPVRNRYMFLKYPNLSGFITFFIKTKLEEYLFPSNYFICKKRNRGYE
jgi:ubiquinone/menaquinone biosynthesis C-methylase UbiE